MNPDPFHTHKMFDHREAFARFLTSQVFKIRLLSHICYRYNRCVTDECTNPELVNSLKKKMNSFVGWWSSKMCLVSQLQHLKGTSIIHLDMSMLFPCITNGSYGDIVGQRVETQWGGPGIRHDRSVWWWRFFGGQSFRRLKLELAVYQRYYLVEEA